MEFETQHKTEESRNEYIPKSCDHFKTSNCEPALTPWKQRNGFRLLSAQSTPPSSVFKIRNPFERSIVERLHMSFCSPSVFISKTMTGSDPEKFEWTIDEISQVNPANIEFFNSQFQVKNDPATESIAQNAITNFFNKEHIVLSPELNIKEMTLHKSNLEGKHEVRTSSTQTEMTIPPQLSPGMEQILKGFCSYTQDQQEPFCKSAPEAKEEILRRNLFKDEHILHYANDQLQMDYSPLSPVPNSPALNLLLRSQSKFNHGTPTLYNIPSPSSVSPIDKKISPLRASSISPISRHDSKYKNTRTMIQRLPQSSVTVKSLRYESGDKNNKYPFCQSTPTSNKENHHGLVPGDKENTIDESSPPYNQCYNDFQCNMMRRHKSISKIQFTEDMSVDASKLDFENVESPVTIEKAVSVFTNAIDDFAKFDKEKFENGLVPLSPMQTSQMETPLKKRSASAKNLSRSFGLPREKDEIIPFNDGTNTRIDSGFTDSYNTIDSLGEMTRYGNMQSANYSHTNVFKQCHNCNNISKLNILSVKNASEVKCNHCSKSIKML